MNNHKQLGISPMQSQSKPPSKDCPANIASTEADARAAFERLIAFCKSSDSIFAVFERQLQMLMAALGVCLVRLFLTVRHEKLDVEPYLADGKYRLGEAYEPRILKTAYGDVRYGRRYLAARGGGIGFYPLDAVLGLTADRLSPWVMQWVARLATRMSFKAAQMTCRAALNWAPATETIERVVLGMGREAAPFMQQLGPPPDDGEVLIIEVDGKCAPTATEEELAKRRGKRRVKHPEGCKCQRHRGQQKRTERGSKKRRKRGDKSKNGKEATVVVMYTLKRGGDGRLHGPLNKKVYGTFAGRKAAASWARAEATRRGFPPGTTKTVQVVMDAASGQKYLYAKHFPDAIFTLDVCHVVERLWAVGRHFHKEGSPELKVWVEEYKELIYRGEVQLLVTRLTWLHDLIPKQGPGNAARRRALKGFILYVRVRKNMMRYREWREADLVIASGQVEGAVRQLVGERFDCSGMRWVREKAEALLHLRCIELNGDWTKYVEWFEGKLHTQLAEKKKVRVLTEEGIKMPEVSKKKKRKCSKKVRRAA